MMLTLYARKEPTTDQLILKLWPSTKVQDVVIYCDKKCTKELSRHTWGNHKQLDKRNKYVFHNCYKYKLEWI